MDNIFEGTVCCVIYFIHMNTNTRKIFGALIVLAFVGGSYWYYQTHRVGQSGSYSNGSASSSPSANPSGQAFQLPTSTPHVTPPTTPPPSGVVKSRPVVSGSGIKGIAKIGPTCPVQPAYDPTGKCADRPFAGKFEIKSSIGTIVKTFSTGTTGSFTIALPVGTYSIEPLTGTYYPHMNPVVGIIVKANQFTSVTIQFDSGIR